MSAAAWKRSCPVVLALLGLSGCSSPPGNANLEHQIVTPVADSSPTLPAPPARPHLRVELDGRDFPDRVVALTWDDGPDSNTLELAEYLASRRISATFFVVDEWAGNLSDEPGRGAHEFETGYAYIPILGDLVALGHRLGNHTANHVVLRGAPPTMVDYELRENQRNIDPYLTNELRVFRCPGGAWDDDAGNVVESDPALQGLVGPVRWDVDRKDWESSLFCRSDHPSLECEPSTKSPSRVRASVTARRYVESVTQAGHGIVLFHDRVGDVGSDYALRVARQVLPALEAAGFVFAAPVLSFGAWRPRVHDTLTADWLASLDPASIRFIDVNGDGRADLCGRGTGPLACARSIERPGDESDRAPETVFEWDAITSGSFPRGFAAMPPWALRGDLNGDGRVDECMLRTEGVSCALRAGDSLLGWTTWLPRTRPDVAAWFRGEPRVTLADVNGDGRADLCSVGDGGVACALAP
jgi:peptidoglycan/xylan/chitin deacetylase (PgdA/CDA1 family)